jgi:hypothetical protein
MRNTFEMSSKIGDLSRLITKITPIFMTWDAILSDFHGSEVVIYWRINIKIIIKIRTFSVAKHIIYIWIYLTWLSPLYIWLNKWTKRYRMIRQITHREKSSLHEIQCSIVESNTYFTRIASENYIRCRSSSKFWVFHAHTCIEYFHTVRSYFLATSLVEWLIFTLRRIIQRKMLFEVSALLN